MACLESGRELLYKDETTKTLCARMCSLLPNAAQASALLNTVTLAGVMYALKMLRDEESDVAEILNVISGANATA